MYSRSLPKQHLESLHLVQLPPTKLSANLIPKIIQKPPSAPGTLLSSEPKFCTTCGNKFHTGHKYCGGCGKKREIEIWITYFFIYLILIRFYQVNQLYRCCSTHSIPDLISLVSFSYKTRDIIFAFATNLPQSLKSLSQKEFSL
jgi:hypothetical protein